MLRDHKPPNPVLW